jgi:hypothetical protein
MFLVFGVVVLVESKFLNFWAKTSVLRGTPEVQRWPNGSWLSSSYKRDRALHLGKSTSNSFELEDFFIKFQNHQFNLYKPSNYLNVRCAIPPQE